MEAGQQRSCHDPAGILTLLIAVGSPLEIAERQRATVAMRRSILTGGMVICERLVVGYEDPVRWGMMFKEDFSSLRHVRHIYAGVTLFMTTLL